MKKQKHFQKPWTGKAFRFDIQNINYKKEWKQSDSP